MSNSEKPKIRRLGLVENGPLYVDPKLKKEGHHYRIVNDTPGNIDKFKRIGYSVEESNTNAESSHIDTGSKIGSATTIEVGRSRPQKAVLMSVPSEIKEEIDEERRDINREVERSVGNVNIPRENLYGSIKHDK